MCHVESFRDFWRAAATQKGSVFPAGTANVIFCSAQQVTSLIFIHESIMPRFGLLGVSALYRADCCVADRAVPSWSRVPGWLRISWGLKVLQLLCDLPL